MPKASAQTRLETALTRIEQSEARIGAFVEYDVENALAQAKASDLLQDPPRPLEGVVTGIKDVIDVAGLATRFGSRAFADAAPAAKDATVVGRLRAAGATILGKLTTTEFAFTDPTDTDNPAAPGHTPGGSSSGSAAAVAAGMVELSLGTQTAGSVCRPAAYCGVAAFKPSTGSLPLEGVAPLSPAFDTVGTMARDMSLAVRAWQVCAGLDDVALPPVRLNDLRIGVLIDPFYQNPSPAVAEALERAVTILRDHGAIIVPTNTGVDHVAVRADHRTMMFSAAASHHGDLLAQSEVLRPNWRKALEAGQAISMAEYRAAEDRLRDARSRLQAHAGSVDVLLLPPAMDVAPRGHASTGDAGFIVPWTVMGGPMAVLPIIGAKGGAFQGPPRAVMLTSLPGRDGWLGALSCKIEQAFK